MKKICITGASRGIGLAEALLLKKSNELYLSASKLKSFENKGLDECNLFGYDFSKLENIDKFVNEIKSKTNKIDLLINNVGIFILKNFIDYTEEEINSLIDINLKANILITKKLLPLLLNSDNPQIIFMSSMSAKSSINGESIYSVTKAGITNFSNILRNELGDKIRITTIHSWGVNTFGANKSNPILKPKDIAKIVKFISNCKKPLLIESIDLSHQSQWRGGKAPWSPN